MKTLPLLLVFTPLVLPVEPDPELYVRSFQFAPYLPTAGAVTRGGVADLNGDTLPDAVVLDGDRVLYLECIEAHDVTFDTGLVGLDVAALPTGGAGGAGSLLIAGASGLVHATFNTGTRVFDTPAVFGGPWAAAQRVVTADLDGQNMLDVVGLGAFGDVLVAYSESASSVSFGATTSFAPLQAPIDVAVVDWDGVGDPEVAVLGIDGLEIYALGGGAPLEVVALAPGRRARAGMAVVSGGGVQGVAWVSTGGGQFLLHHATDGGSPTAVDLLGMNVIALAAGDLQGDGADELFASRKDAAEVTRLGGDASVGFSATAGVLPYPVGPPSTSMAANKAVPILADVDLDTDLDLLFVNEPAAEVWLHRGTEVEENLQRVSIDSNPIIHVTDRLDVVFTLPSAPGEGVPTHLETRAWHRPAQTTIVSPDPVWVAVDPLPSLPGTLQQDLQLDNQASDETVQQVFFLETRLVRKSGEETVRRWPAAIHSFSANDEARAEMLATPHHGEEIVVLAAGPGEGGPGEGGGTTGKGGSGNYPPNGPPPSP